MGKFGSDVLSNTKGNTTVSGSFGGKPKTLRSQNFKKRQTALPAWMLGKPDEEDES